ncbi:tryptophan synthase alpha chain [Haloactinopolyspora alba]|uniref:Tryptophan synthase alpha chain n=1 Tax=Haloactinopolyspora alba TaxID=648780 RepID=A0A2P8E3Y5_9ACTN|nr:tryptophan synthase subunit alpha [Haloactinopolyspora alba]PSL04179.1 tryptophan synthase alpha chain [Haloactinopolyspora alba]
MSTATAFEKARAEGRATLVGYLPAGYPSVDGSITAIRAMVDAGVDVVEVGLPYTDPLIDGPTIQTAVNAALQAGTRTPDVLRVVEAVAETGTPAVVMSYWNPLARYGADAFARDLAAAGGAGVITPDLTPDATDEWIPAARSRDLDTVFLVAPSSTDERIAMTTDACRGFVYATSVMGVTGTREQVGDAAAVLVERTRKATDLPVAVGLGVSNADQAAEIAGFADGVVVGSAFVRRMLDAADVDDGVAAVAALAGELSGGVRRR